MITRADDLRAMRRGTGDSMGGRRSWRATPYPAAEPRKPSYLAAGFAALIAMIP